MNDASSSTMSSILAGDKEMERDASFDRIGLTKAMLARCAEPI
jgi:hypothetical protein